MIAWGAVVLTYLSCGRSLDQAAPIWTEIEYCDQPNEAGRISLIYVLPLSRNIHTYYSEKKYYTFNVQEYPGILNRVSLD
ncbi:hypothetical protein F4781DRAFT_306338 [Annulohypoxylon bovei var. microspora]|nr:hypothetical protein F4781DRAFT_306338 [Annulohypoxylon bovei var. microspora]